MKRRKFLEKTLQAGAAAFSTPLLTSLSGCGSGQRSDPWQIGIYTRPWSQFNYLSAFDAIAETGYQYIGLMTTKSESGLVISVTTSTEEAAGIGEEIRKRGLTVVSVYGGSFPVKESLKAGIDGLIKLVDNTAACGC
ncbi:hypothetical protein BVY01_01650, partial [bacterium I07]